MEDDPELWGISVMYVSGSSSMLYPLTHECRTTILELELWLLQPSTANDYYKYIYIYA